MVSLVGYHPPGVDATVVDYPVPAAFVIPGRDRRVVITTGALDRLVEMCADEAAAVDEPSRLALARALVTLAPLARPAPHLSATGSDVPERVHRLLDPPAPLGRWARLAVAAALFALPLLPVLAILATSALRGLSLW